MHPDAKGSGVVCAGLSLHGEPLLGAAETNSYLSRLSSGTARPPNAASSASGSVCRESRGGKPQAVF